MPTEDETGDELEIEALFDDRTDSIAPTLEAEAIGILHDVEQSRMQALHDGHRFAVLCRARHRRAQG